MAETIARPGVEVEQRFESPAPTIFLPTLGSCIIGPSKYIVDAFNADGTLNTDAKITPTQYDNTAIEITQDDFPDPRNISGNINVEEDSIRVYLVTGGTSREVLRTEAYLAPTAPATGNAGLDPGNGFTDVFIFAQAASGLTGAVDVRAGDRIIINGNLVRIVESAVDNSPNIEVTMTSTISVTIDDDGPVPYFIIATSDLTARGLTADLVIDIQGDVNFSANLIRTSDGSPSSGAAADIYIQYEALRLDVTANPVTGTPGFLTIDDQEELDESLGPLSSRNPLAVGVLFALINSPTASVSALGVDEVTTAAPNGTLASYNRALSFLEGKEVYGLVPLTQDATIHQVFSVHVTSMSAADQKRERVCIINQAQPDTQPDETQASGNLANTIVRGAPLTGGFSTTAEDNARVESDLGAALVNAGAVTVSQLVDIVALRDAGLYLQIAGGVQKFLLRTVVGFDLEIVESLSSSTIPGVGPDGGSPATRPSAASGVLTFPGGSFVTDFGVKDGDVLVIIESTPGNNITGTFTISDVDDSILTIDDPPAGSDLTVTRYKVMPNPNIFTSGNISSTVEPRGFQLSDPGSPFANQSWAVKTIGEALVVPGTNPPIIDRDAVVEVLAAVASSFRNRRVLFVQPDTVATTAITGVEEVLPGFYLSCAIAGMTGEQEPEQGFTNFPIAGFTRLVNSNDVYSDRQIDVARAGGVYWVSQEATGASVASVHQLTTDVSSIETREYSITKVVDYTAKFLRSGLKRLIGTFNITPEFLDQLSTVIQGMLQSLIAEGHLINATLDRIVVDESQPDRILVDITLDVPFPSNFIKITLIV